jgi:GH25 family lysozyme M1 (1,4-beta-N-acetylmuramidase)
MNKSNTKILALLLAAVLAVSGCAGADSAPAEESGTQEPADQSALEAAADAGNTVKEEESAESGSTETEPAAASSGKTGRGAAAAASGKTDMKPAAAPSDSTENGQTAAQAGNGTGQHTSPEDYGRPEEPADSTEADMNYDEVDQKAYEGYHFVDVFQNEYEAVIDENFPRNIYFQDSFVWEEDRMTYAGDDRYIWRTGIDVSEHDEDIDWQQVRDAGIDFVFIRAGYRGYSEGSLRQDAYFEKNLREAREAGLDVGVYFFSQAVNEAEALEEADLVLRMLDGQALQMPVVYDPESILNDAARTDDISGDQFTRNALAFCGRIRERGYAPMIYANLVWEAFEFDLSRIRDIPIWYADYEPVPQTPYFFTVWQYTDSGTVPGIVGPVDLNLQLIPQE